MKKIGIYGGSFNPIHIGHLHVAEEVKTRLNLDKVIFVPAGNPYFKDQSTIADFGARAAMVRDSIRGMEGFEVSEIEGNTYAPSYASETLTLIHEWNKSAKLYLIIGEDAFYEFHKWHDVDTIIQLATVVVVQRGGIIESVIEHGNDYIDWCLTEQRKRMEEIRVKSDISLSSSYIREQIKNGGAFRYLVPHCVYKRIVNEKLYDYGGDDYVIY